jgi:hypothetical protein
MEHVLPMIQEIAGRISGAEMKRKSLARFLRSAESDFKIAYPVGKAGLDGMKIAGVDGGIVKRSLHGFDFVLARAAGVCFSYHGGKIAGVEYHPSRNPAPELFVLESLSELDWVHSASIIRQKLEIRNAIETAGKFRPGLLLLDGSLVPHYSDRPAKSSKVRDSYEELISLYNGLFGTCSKNGIMLAGVVEDSRGMRFSEIAGEKILSASSDDAEEMRKVLETTRDTALLYWLLDEGERTFAFAYSDVGEEHPLAKEFGSFGNRIFSFYLKAAKFDRPVRIDFLCGEGGECEKDADRLAQTILSISSHHSGYGFPSVLIEADQAAKLAEEDIEGVYDQILARTGPLPGVAKLRRDERPF